MNNQEEVVMREINWNEIQKLSNEEVQNRLKDFILKERKNTALFIAHLSVVAKRKSHLGLGYKSLFDYCTQHLNLSEGSTYRRIQVAKVCNKLPEILSALGENKISLTVASQLAPHLNEDNAKKLIRDCFGKSKKQVEVYLVSLNPKKTVYSGMKKKVSNRLNPNEDFSLDLEIASPEKKSDVEPAQEEIYNFRFSAGEGFKGKIERLAEILGIDNPQGNLEEIIDKALELALDKKDPQRKLERRRKRQEKKKDSPEAKSVKKVKSSKPIERSRYIPDKTREVVLERANYQCEYQSDTGRRCCQRTHLQIDHVIPWALGGSNDPENLRALCQSHNLYEAQRFFPGFYEDQFH